MPPITPEQLALFPLWYVAFLLSLTCHEAAHALAAQLGGDNTAAHGGQVSLNPLPHVRQEPFGTVLMPVLSYLMNGWMMGWASAPYDPYWRLRHPHRAAWMALAGPGANFCLVLLSGIVARLGILAGVFVMPDAASFSHIVDSAGSHAAEGAALFVSIVFSLNLVLGLFNLLPIPPLDGSSAIGLLVSESTAARLYQSLSSPMFRIMGLLLAWRLFEPVFGPAFGIALRLLYPGASYV